VKIREIGGSTPAPCFGRSLAKALKARKYKARMGPLAPMIETVFMSKKLFYPSVWMLEFE
jgi:hypothetical protein